MKEQSGKRKDVRRPPRFTLPVVKGEETMWSESAAEFLGLTPGTFYNYVSEGQVVPNLRVRGRPVFFKSALEAWRRRHTVVTATETAASA